MDPVETRVLTCATLITMDPERRILRDGAVVIRKDRIAWVGLQRALPGEFALAPRQDFPGHVLVPGFVNLHVHATLSILRGIVDDRGTAPAYSPNVPQGVFLSPEDCYLYSLLGGAEALCFGTTCIVDNYIHEEQAARAFDRLGMRAVVSERLHDADLFQIPHGIFSFDAARGEELLDRGLALLDKWNKGSNGRIRARLGPHAPDTCSGEYLQRIREEAERNNVGMVIHLSQSPGENAEIHRRTGQTPTAYLARLGLLGPGMIAGHCIYTSDEDHDLFARTGTQVVHLSGSNAIAGAMAPIRLMRQKGIRVGLGTDNVAGDMIEVMRMALCIARMRDHDMHALMAQDVLEMATIRGAEALGMAQEIGSIQVGKKADLVFIDFNRLHLVPVVDPVANLVHDARGGDITHVMVDGTMVVQEGRVLGVDEPDLIREAQAVAEVRWKDMAARK